MNDIPKTIGVLTINPKTSKKILNIVKEYFKDMPYISYPLNDSLYILPNTKTMDSILNKIHYAVTVHLVLDIFRGAIYEYNAANHTYDISVNSCYGDILPRYIRISELNPEKLESFSED